jgi:OOP family OmpA-OmpF porin
MSAAPGRSQASSRRSAQHEGFPSCAAPGRLRYGGLLLTIWLLAACAPASRVILLPQADGRPSAVEVKSSAGVQVLSRPYQVASVSSSGQLQLGETTATEVQSQYPQLLSLQVAPAQRFTLYFAEGGARLTPESESQLGEVIARAAARPGGEILVTGHTDRVGSAEANDALSLQRARAIRDLLVARGFQPELIEAIGRGEREPLVPTADEVTEPSNRRAEIVVR